MLSHIGTIYKFPALLTLQGQERIASLYNPVIPGLLHFLFLPTWEGITLLSGLTLPVTSLLHQALDMEPSSLSLPSVSTQAIITEETDVKIQTFSLLLFKVWSWVLGYKCPQEW